MTQDEIISMMRQACDPDKVDAWNNDFWAITQPELERFAELVAAHEREACACLLDQAAAVAKQIDPSGFVWKAVAESAEAIRARRQE